MRLIAAALLMMTSACTRPDRANPGDESAKIDGVTPVTRCDAAGAAGLVGQPATSELGAEALALAGARSIRWIQPDQAVTMDYRQGRLNLHLNAGNRVERVTCG